MPNLDRQRGESHIPTLVRQAQGGSRKAFEKLVDLHQEAIFRMVYYRTRSSMDAEDLTQEIFMRAFYSISKLKSVDRFRGWLFCIAVNRVRDFQRKQRFRSLFVSSSESDDSRDTIAETGPSDPLGSLMKQEFWRQISSFQEKLSPMEREVFMLRFMDHLSIREISHALEKGESTVKTHLYRSLQKFKGEDGLRQFLQESHS